jgi:hypothetical protein
MGTHLWNFIQKDTNTLAKRVAGQITINVNG